MTTKTSSPPIDHELLARVVQFVTVEPLPAGKLVSVAASDKFGFCEEMFLGINIALANLREILAIEKLEAKLQTEPAPVVYVPVRPRRRRARAAAQLPLFDSRGLTNDFWKGSDMTDDTSHDKAALARAGRQFFEAMSTALDDGLCPACASRAALATVFRVTVDAMESEHEARAWMASVMEGDDDDHPVLH